MSQSIASTQNCPSCGAAAPPLLKHSKLAVCNYCNSTLFVNDAQVQSAGEKSVLSETPSILTMACRFQMSQWTFEPIGRIRYEYGSGETAGSGDWDEWWVLQSDGKTRWISNDEGEYVVQNKVALQGDPPPYENLVIGTDINLFSQKLRVTELNCATCLGVEGQLPEVIKIGDSHRYAHLESAKGVLITAEYDEQDAATFHKGLWVDPFDIKAL